MFASYFSLTSPGVIESVNSVMQYGYVVLQVVIPSKLFSMANDFRYVRCFDLLSEINPHEAWKHLILLVRVNP